MNAQAFVAAVESLVGTPTRHMGRDPGIALDCVGVPMAACAIAGMPVESSATYHALPSPGLLEAQISRYCDPIDASDMRAGDLLVGAIGLGARHIMILVQGAYVVHAGTKKVVRERLRRGHRIASAWRIRGIEWP